MGFAGGQRSLSASAAAIRDPPLRNAELIPTTPADLRHHAARVLPWTLCRHFARRLALQADRDTDDRFYGYAKR